MRVLLVAKPWRGGLARYVRRALEEMYPNSVHWCPSQPETAGERLRYRRDRSAWRRRLVERINATPYDLGLFIGAIPEFEHLEPRNGNVLWLYDDPTRWLELSPAFRALYISDPGYRGLVQASEAGRRFAGVLPFAHAPEVHAPTRCTGPRRGVCFIGNRDLGRDAALGRLAESGLPLHVYGNYFVRHGLFWRHPLRFRPRVPIAGMARIYARHQVSLNIHARVVRGGTNMRTFECAGYGIPQVVEHREGLDELFEPEREILVYRDLDEMVAQIERILGDPVLAVRLAERARQRAATEHTYGHRVRAICAQLGL